MTNIFEDDFGVACRCCGAVRAAPPYPDEDSAVDSVCRNCWHSFKRYRERVLPRKTTIDDDFDKWLARKLVLEIRRLAQYGVTGRCEAITNSTEFNAGYQCASHAILRINSRRLCASHGMRASDVVWASEHATEVYDTIETIIKSAAKKDYRFKLAVIRAGKDLAA